MSNRCSVILKRVKKCARCADFCTLYLSFKRNHKTCLRVSNYVRKHFPTYPYLKFVDIDDNSPFGSTFYVYDYDPIIDDYDLF